jgi:hypothetical protein
MTPEVATVEGSARTVPPAGPGVQWDSKSAGLVQKGGVAEAGVSGLVLGVASHLK